MRESKIVAGMKKWVFARGIRVQIKYLLNIELTGIPKAIDPDFMVTPETDLNLSITSLIVNSKASSKTDPVTLIYPLENT